MTPVATVIPNVTHLYSYIYTVCSHCSTIIELHVTPVQYVTHGDIVQLKCEINVTVAVSRVLPDDMRITWYDGFIPMPAVGNVYEINGYQLRQIIVNITVTDWLHYGRYICKIEDNNGTVTMRSSAVIPEGILI